MKPLKVHRTVGLNPVAQAVFRARFSGYMIDTKIRVLMLDDGEPCRDLLESAGYVLAVIGHGCDLQQLKGPEERILRGGLSALSQMSSTGLWDKTQAVAVERALEHAEELLKRLKPLSVSRSVQQLAAIEH